MLSETPVKTPTRIKPSIEPAPDPVRRYAPGPNHCPAQWVRTTRRIRS